MPLRQPHLLYMPLSQAHPLYAPQAASPAGPHSAPSPPPARRRIPLVLTFSGAAGGSCSVSLAGAGRGLLGEQVEEYVVSGKQGGGERGAGEVCGVCVFVGA